MVRFLQRLADEISTRGKQCLFGNKGIICWMLYTSLTRVDILEVIWNILLQESIQCCTTLPYWIHHPSTTISQEWVGGDEDPKDLDWTETKGPIFQDVNCCLP